MKKVISTFLRIFVGGLFIFSGFIKLNDPVGTEIKLEEYFEVFSNDIASFFAIFIPTALFLSVVLSVLEVVLGVAVLINFRMKQTTWALLSMIVFFTFLTFYSAYFNKVTDCGCFGDAIKLTPWQSFTKDIILLVFILPLWLWRNELKPIYNKNIGNFTVGLSVLFSMFIAIYAILHLPFIDFRSYAVGKNIPQLMQPEEPPIIEYTFEKDGETITSKEYLTEENGYKYISYQTTNIEKSTPKITDFQVWNDDGDFTNYVFEKEKLLIIIHSANKTKGNLSELKELIDDCEKKNIKPVILTSSSGDEINSFRHEYQLASDYYFADATVLKTMIRSNYGLILLKNGIVKAKWHYNDVPDVEDVIDEL